MAYSYGLAVETAAKEYQLSLIYELEAADDDADATVVLRHFEAVVLVFAALADGELLGYRIFMRQVFIGALVDDGPLVLLVEFAIEFPVLRMAVCQVARGLEGGIELIGFGLLGLVALELDEPHAVINATCLMVYTDNFNKFELNSRKIGCNYGIAPLGDSRGAASMADHRSVHLPTE